MSGHHGHGESGTPHGRAFALGIGINTAFIVAEVLYGLAAHSVALVADAAHNFGDVIGLALAWGAGVLATRATSPRRTYGFRRATVLAALANALLLMAALGGVVWEAITRLAHPAPADGRTVVAVAGLGVLVNGGTALLFMRGRARDANVAGAFFHLASDAAVSLAVVISALVYMRTAWAWLDPVTSIVVALFVLVSGWSLLRTSLDLALDAVPGHIDLEKIRAHLVATPEVVEVHDLHAWPLSTTETALTVHLVIGDGLLPPTLVADLERTFAVDHVTCQVERTPCQHARRGL